MEYTILGNTGMKVSRFCHRFNIAMMCYGPLCGGILTGKYHGPHGAPQGSRGEGNTKMQAYLEDESVQAIVAELKKISDMAGIETNQLAILWLKSKPHATSIILGGSKPEHFQQSYEIADRELPEEIIERIDRISASRVYTSYRNQPVREGPGLAEQR